ncbi:MAG: hypothetical protein MUE54_04045 [Anaerolineae bacterium]|jgi:hypothetical protein|nr:hypothetical protein [Anaerolineae bacterium]
MSQKRQYLFDETVTEDATRPRTPSSPPPKNKKRGFRWMLWMLLGILTLGLGTGTAILVARPDVYGLEFRGNLTLTAGAFAQTASALGQTADANAQVSRDNFATSTALAGQIGDVVAQQTTIAQDQLNTQTAVAVQNAQNATQAAINFQNTQAAANQQATQIALDFAMTQAALNQSATQNALDFATQVASIPTPTITPIPTNTPSLQDSFIGGVDASQWRFASVGDWGFHAGGGLIAIRDGSWLITQQSDYNQYRLDAVIQPSVGAGNYVMILNIGANGDNLAVRFIYDGAQIVGVGIITFVVDDFLGDGGLLTRANPELITLPLTIPKIRQNIAFSIAVNSQTITITVDASTALTYTLETPISPGAVGIQLPKDTVLETILVLR